MELDALAAERTAAGRDLRMQGSVKVTATAWMIDGVLAPLVAAFSSNYPQLELELMADVRHLNLARREADVALRASSTATSFDDKWQSSRSGSMHRTPTLRATEHRTSSAGAKATGWLR
jgi:DNA-binding transcriptional LysR family regulator